MPRLTVVASLVGFDPSQFYSCLRAADDVCIAAGPTCRFLSIHPDRWFLLSGDQPSLILPHALVQAMHPLKRHKVRRLIQDAQRGSWVWPASNPRRTERLSAPVDAALGFDCSCRCSDTAALLARHASHARNIASIASPGGPLKAAIRSWALSNDGDEVARSRSNRRRAAAVAALQRFSRLTPGRSGAVTFDRIKLPV